MSHDASDGDGVLDDNGTTPAYDEAGGRPTVTAGSLLREGLADLWRQPSVVLAMALAGLAVFLLASVPLAGPVLASLGVALQVATVAAFVRRID